ncbi:hypothetical protein PHMEG_00025405 [Phytophthora megakarya]|uniref:Uncharacterized protein n=1 Tax=Phytophthora megakarya TaxID=4795 RepID=A0A225VDR6_9STRA|nr:hypothetical protein PHMEG_00025405 [Phytophthora megakarya]
MPSASSAPSSAPGAPSTAARPPGSNSTSAPRPRARALLPSLVLPTLTLAPPALDLASVRGALGQLAAVVDHADALESLVENHHALQLVCRDLQARVCALEQEIDDNFAAARPFVEFVEHKYLIVLNQRNRTQADLGEALEELQDRRDDSAELLNVRARLQTTLADHIEELECLHREIDALETRLSAARAVATQSSPADALRLAALHRECDQLRVDLRNARDAFRTQGVAIHSAENIIRAHEARLKKLEDSEAHLLRHMSKLESLLGRAQARHQRACEERDRFSDAAAVAEAATRRLTSELDEVTIARDKAVAASQSFELRAASLHGDVVRLQQDADATRVDQEGLETLQVQVGILQQKVEDVSRENGALSLRVLEAETACHVAEEERDQASADLLALRSEPVANVAPFKILATPRLLHALSLGTSLRVLTPCRLNSTSPETKVTHPSVRILRDVMAPSGLADPLRDADSASDDPVMVALSGRPTLTPPPAPSDLAGTARDRPIELDADDDDAGAEQTKTPVRVPDDSDWDAAFLDEGNVSVVYASTPWGVLAKPVTPISFERDSPHFQTLSRKLDELQTKHRQAAWESTHSFPISEDLRRAVTYFAILYAEGRQRWSRFGAAWKSFLKFVLLCIVAGHCDLDILLDRVFLHFPRPGECSKWYPGLHCTPRPANLFQALRDVDRQDPWRNQYRHAIEDHPGSQLPRLEGKFIPQE